MPAYKVVKTYGNERGYSCVFRQHKAESHCRFLHGYSLGFELTFACNTDELTREGWVIDFGDLKAVENYLESWFDHTVLISEEDPAGHIIKALDEEDLACTKYVYKTGCEAFAKMVFDFVKQEVSDRIISVKCFEHGANAAVYALLPVPKPAHVDLWR